MSATLDHLLEPISPFLDSSDNEEVCINGPDDVWVFGKGLFMRRNVKINAEHIEDIAIVAAAQRRQDVGYDRPLLNTELLGRGRLAAVLEPTTERGCPSLTIRRGSDDWPEMEELARQGLFKNTSRKRRKRTPNDDRLMELYQQEKFAEFLTLAVQSRKTIIACGQNASGKTHVSKALLGKIPLWERIITIENAPELRGLPHPNRVQMFYNAEALYPKPTDLVSIALRMRIERLFIQEIRTGDDMIAFLIANQTGHRGAVTTIHASHCAAAFDRMRVLIKQTAGGAAISDDDIKAQLYETVDIVVHNEREDARFGVDEIWFGAAERSE